MLQKHDVCHVLISPIADVVLIFFQPSASAASFGRWHGPSIQQSGSKLDAVLLFVNRSWPMCQESKHSNSMLRLA